jgi:probable F420-dependent oxidoreductase
MNLRKPGILAYFDTMTAPEIAGFIPTIERLGYSVLWIPETFGRDPFVMAARVLGASERLIAGTAIANVWKREPMAAGAASRTLAELYPDRFILGLGVSAGPFMVRNGLKFEKPVSYMREYLDGIRNGPFKAPMPAQEPPVVLAGLLPKMLRLGIEQSDGIITALTPPSRVAAMRREMGPGKLLLAQQMVMLERDAATARAGVRTFMRFYLNAPPYRRYFTSMGFDENDMREGGSDRLLDAVIAWGGEDILHDRIRAHYEAGADHVYIIPLSADGGRLPDMRVIEALAPG